MTGFNFVIWSKIIIGVVLVALLTAFAFWQNNDIVTTQIEYVNNSVPIEFDGFKIVQISDLHSKTFGSDQEPLISLTDKAAPDIIVITGDMIDAYHTNIDAAMVFAEAAVKIAPVYFVPGNHEHRTNDYSELKNRLEKAGVVILDDKKIEIERDEGVITLIGLRDQDFSSTKKFANTLEKLNENASGFVVLLSHRPEKMDLYTDCGIDLAFTGHAHGGQIRLPFIGGLFAPSQGFPPKYTSGLYTENDTSMVVSRGLGNSGFPLRIFNRPEIVVVTLRSR